MFGWLQRAKHGRRSTQDLSTEELRREKSRVELTDLKLGVTERQLKIDAIRRVVDGEPDPVTALEIVTVATHRGRLSPAVYQRRNREQSPLEMMAMTMLQKRLDEDPTDALERILERRERLEEAADRLAGGRRGEDADSGNTLVDMARAVVNSPLGEAIGTVLGAGMQQQMAAAAAKQQQAQLPVGLVAPPADDGSSSPVDPAALPTAAPSSAPIPRPTSFRVSMALRVLKSLDPAGRARWVLGQAEQNPQLADLVGQFVSAEPQDVPIILESYATEAAASGDPAIAEWLPLVEHMRGDLEWTLATHEAMRQLVDDDELDNAAGA